MKASYWVANAQRGLWQYDNVRCGRSWYHQSFELFVPGNPNWLIRKLGGLLRQELPILLTLLRMPCLLELWTPFLWGAKAGLFIVLVGSSHVVQFNCVHEHSFQRTVHSIFFFHLIKLQFLLKNAIRLLCTVSLKWK